MAAGKVDYHEDRGGRQMGVKKSVFGSIGEKSGFRSIEREWGDRYRLWPQLPFYAIFEPDDTINGTSNLFFKTSVDYTLSTREGEPLMAIEFDGMGHGFSRDGRYLAVRNTDDPNRKAKFDFKLTYAKRYEFPFYIVSYEEMGPVGGETQLTVVDGDYRLREGPV